MKLSEYFNFVKETSVFPQTHMMLYPMIALRGEAGEVLNVWKKVLRAGELTPESSLALKDELGDVFWYLVACYQCTPDFSDTFLGKFADSIPLDLYTHFAVELEGASKGIQNGVASYYKQAQAKDARKDFKMEVSTILLGLFHHIDLFPQDHDELFLSYLLTLSFLGFTLEEVLMYNMDKLNQRRNK